MYIKLYNKLVRDNIPTVIEATGKECEYEQLSDERVMEYLYVKLYEEADELVRDKNIEELADILEVVFAIANKYGYTEEDVLEVMEYKREARGGFNNNILLKKVIDKNK